MTPLTADDRFEINEKLSLLGHLVDSGQVDRLEEVFTADAVYDLADVGMGSIQGVEAIRQGALRLGAHGPVAHHLTNVVITGEDDDVVSVLSKGFLLMADGTVQSLVHQDVVVRAGGGWRVSRHVITAQRTPMGGNHPATT